MAKRFFWGLFFSLLFAASVYLVKTYDVAPIGPQGTEVGFSHINQTVHDLTGVNMQWYEITEYIGYAALAVAAFFALAGLVQMIKRRSLFKVDGEIIALGFLYVAVVAAYVAFEKYIINYRPVIMPGATAPEASFPSSHTMLIITVMGSAMMLIGRYVRSDFLKFLLRLICFAAIVVTVGGRLYSGAHWLTDVLAGIILSAALLEFYSAAIYKTRRSSAKYSDTDRASAESVSSGGTEGAHYSKHAKSEPKKGFFRVLFGLIGKLLLIVVLLAAALFGFLSVTEYKPDDRVTLTVEGDGSKTLAPGDTFSIVTWNIGYGALGDNADFFMDGGKGVKTADLERVNSNLDGIVTELNTLEPDILFVQEADQDSARSEHINEVDRLSQNMTGTCYAFANNFKVAFLPFPVPPIGKVDSGIATFSAYPMASAERIQLPIPFKWPVRMANLKRCVLETRVPLEGTDKELVLMNLHLEAYDSGEGKIEQTKMLAGLVKAEVAKGNYVIAGGDFNQIFSSEDSGIYPAQEGKWAAGEIPVDNFTGKWQFLMDERTPTCRSLDQPYAGADHSTFQYYLIDGFIVSDNIKVKLCETQDAGFVYSDHNPVLAELTLEK